MASEGPPGHDPIEPIILSWPRKGVLQITLNRPEKLNALTAELIEQLHGVLARTREDSQIRAVVLTGAGRAFSAGIDLHGYGDPPGSGEEGRIPWGMRVQQHLAELGPAFRALRAPVIAAVNGPAAGGGMALALFSDVRIMSRSATFHASFIQRGLGGCDLGVSWLLPRMIGFSRAAELLLTGGTVDAATAERIGLASRVVDDEDDLLEAALDTATSIARHSPFGVWMTKEVLWTNLEVASFTAAIELENRTQVLTTLTQDHREAVVSFLEKRTPLFTNT